MKGNSMTEKKYDIGGKSYVQKPLVLGQLRQLLAALKGVTIPTNVDSMGLVDALNDHLPAALAIVLIPEGFSPRDKDIEALAAEIEFAITPEQIFEVVEDFFVCNPLPSLLDRLGMAAGKIMEQMTAGMGSMTSASSLPAETLPAGTESSGGSPTESAGAG